MDRLGDELRTVIAPQVVRRDVQGHEVFESLDHVHRLEAASCGHEQARLRELVGDRQDLQHATVSRRVEQEIDGPHVVWRFRPVAFRPVDLRAETTPLLRLRRDTQTV